MWVKNTERFMDIYFCYPVNLNILSIALKIFVMFFFWNTMLYKSG